MKTVCRIPKKLIFATILLFFCIAYSLSQESVLHLTVEDAVHYAIQGNLSLKQSEISLSSAKRAADTSWNTVLPSVTASGTFSQSFIDPGISSLSVGGTISLRLNPSIYTSIKSAALSYEQQQITYESAQRTIEFNVRQLFYTLLYSQEYVSLLKNSVDSAQRQYDADRAKYNRGTLPRVNVLSDQVQLQSAQLSYDSQNIALANNLASFKQILGISQDTEIALDGSINDILNIQPITKEDVDAVRKVSTTMSGLEKQREIAQNGLLATRFAAWGPTVSASYNIGWSGNNAAMDYSSGTAKQVKGDFEFGSDPSQHGISIGISIPLDGYLPWSSGGQSIANQKANLETIELNIQNQQITEEINIQNYLNTIKSTQENMRLGQSNVELAQQNYNLTADAYNNGTRSLLELQSARDNLNSARVNTMANASTLITAILNLENTIGVPFGTLLKN